jgi:transposase, IS30 family
MTKGKSFTHLSEEERIKIEVLLHEGLSLTRIACTMKRPICTISREIRRNGPKRYCAVRAQYFTGLRHRQKRKHIVFDQTMRRFIELHLRLKRWSPELISVRGRQWRQDFISTEWIYQWIWSMKFSMAQSDKKYQQLYKFLKYSSRRRRRGRKRNMRGNIIGRKWIEQRSQLANLRKRHGDLEADIILGKDRQPGLLVALDRRSRKTWLRKLRIKDSDYVMKKLANICSEVGNVKTVTLDNDQSFAEHYRLNKLGIKTFFTHPYSSQEKGSVENRIGIIRMFFPKKTEFKQIKQRQVTKVQDIINERPLRIFNYKCPNEIYKS